MILHEDEHLLVVRKPSGINTHAASPHASEGIYDWLRRREPRWAGLAIVQRLDKETSGVLLFPKSARAKVSLLEQFEQRTVTKEYVLLTDREPPESLVARSSIRKGPGGFESVAAERGGLPAETRFQLEDRVGPHWIVRATPVTGRTHQIRLHAAQHGFPVLGDSKYGGSAYHRFCLHARALEIRDPATGEPVRFTSEANFESTPSQELRTAFVDAPTTNAFRLIHGVPDGHPGWYVDRLGEVLTASTLGQAPVTPPDWLVELAQSQGAHAVYLRSLARMAGDAGPEATSSRCAWGEAEPAAFVVLENGLRYHLSLREGGGVGLFLDQRENRRRLRANWVGPDFPVKREGLDGAEVLNVFAYTCGFSVAAAASGATTTSIDLSRKYLAWGQRNFAANDLDPARHTFIAGDAFDWLRRFGKKERRFDVVVLDPPTFSRSRQHGVFRAETDFVELIAAAAHLVRGGGVLLASTNAARLEPEAFLEQVVAGIQRSGREASAHFFFPQPPDFPTSREEPGYLKTAWFRLD